MAVEIANSGKNIRFDCVDHWRGSVEHQQLSSVIRGTLYNDFLRNIEPVQEFVHPISGESVEVATQYEESSLQFVFVDASHDEESVQADLTAWWPTVRIGGWMAGHDFTNDGVGKAVLRYFKNKPVEWLRICDGTWCVRHTPGL